MKAKSLPENNELSSAFFDSATDGIIFFDEQHHIVRFNPAAETIFGCQESDALGKPITAFIPELSPESPKHTGRFKLIGLRPADGIGSPVEFPIDISLSQFNSGRKKFFAATLRDDSESQRIEKELRKSEMRYRALADAANDMIWIINTQGRVDYVNIYAAQQLKKTPQQLVGEMHRNLFPPELARRHWKILQKVMQTGEPAYIESLDSRPDQTTWLGTSLSPLRNDAGEIFGVMGVAHDITARKEAEFALQRHDAILQAVSTAAENFLQSVNLRNHIPNVLARLGQAAQVSRVYIYDSRTDESGNVFTSQRFEWVAPGVKPQLDNPELQNIPLSTLGGGRWLRAFLQGQSLFGHVDELDESGRSLIAGQGIQSVVVVPIFSGYTFWGFMGYDDSKSKRNWSLMEIQALKTAAGILGAAIQREHAEEVLRASEAEYRSLFEHALEGIYRTSPDGKILTANPALIKLLGCDSMDELFSMDFSPYLQAQSDEIDEIRNIEMLLTRRDGQQIMVLNNARKVRDGQGRVIYYEGTVADITERKRAIEQVNRRVSELEALYESGLAMGQALDPRAIGEKVIAVLDDHLNWDHAAVRIRQENSERVELLAFSGGRLLPNEEQKKAHARAKITHISQGLVGWVLQNGRAIRVNNLEADERYVHTFPGMVSGMYVPMIVDGFTIGCISIESPEPNAFSESDERLVTTLSAQAATAIENARLFKQIGRRLEQVSVLHQIDVVISSSADLHSTLKFVLEHVLIQLKVDAAQVLLMDSAAMTLVCADRVGFIAAEPESPVMIGESRAGQAILKRRPLFIPNLNEDPHSAELGFPLEESFLMYGCVPLVAKGETKGVLEVFRREPGVMEDDWMEFFQVLASQTAIAIDNSLMFEDLQRSHRELSLAYDATIEGWSRALDLRDKDTEGHTRRVTELSVRLATALGLSDTEIVHMRRGSLLHDIGKMGVTDAILHKPGPLTEEEAKVMRQHPGYAYDMLMPISYLRPALDIPYSHHEKWDGSGYPLGLKGEAIPLVARIFAISDVFDALTSDRPYRKAWSVEKTLDYLRSQSGRHFDPRIVDAFLGIIKNG